MSYPFTKPVPRYGFRRRWGDPHVGLVGSGPGRPLRTYATDAEVGLPQLGPGLTAMGASPETPFTEGIFSMGPQQGFTRGVFTPDPPWATPRYIAATPDGVSGFGAFGAEPKCGIQELLKKIIDWLPTLKFSASFPLDEAFKAADLPTSFSIGPSPELIEPAVYSLVGTAGEKLGALADKSAGDIAGLLASKVSGPIVQKILASDVIPESAKAAGAPFISKLVDKELRKQLYKVGEIIRDCTGVEKPGPKSGCYCQPDGSFCQDDSWCISKTCKKLPSSPFITVGQCVSPLNQLKFLAEKLKVPITFDPNMSQDDLLKTAASKVKTIQAELKKCAAAGGEWFPGGARCDVNPITKRLENCRKPAPNYGGQRWNCVPKGTPGATSPGGVAAAADDAGVKKASSNLPLILGVAAVAAFLLTTR